MFDHVDRNNLIYLNNYLFNHHDFVRDRADIYQYVHFNKIDEDYIFVTVCVDNKVAKDRYGEDFFCQITDFAYFVLTYVMVKNVNFSIHFALPSIASRFSFTTTFHILLCTSTITAAPSF